jgi:hypothetical protein
MEEKIMITIGEVKVGLIEELAGEEFYKKLVDVNSSQEVEQALRRDAKTPLGSPFGNHDNLINVLNTGGKLVKGHACEEFSFNANSIHRISNLKSKDLIKEAISSGELKVNEFISWKIIDGLPRDCAVALLNENEVIVISNKSIKENNTQGKSQALTAIYSTENSAYNPTYEDERFEKAFKAHGQRIMESIESGFENAAPAQEAVKPAAEIPAIESPTFKPPVTSPEAIAATESHEAQEAHKAQKTQEFPAIQKPQETQEVDEYALEPAESKAIEKSLYEIWGELSNSDAKRFVEDYAKELWNLSDDVSRNEARDISYSALYEQYMDEQKKYLLKKNEKIVSDKLSIDNEFKMTLGNIAIQDVSIDIIIQQATELISIYKDTVSNLKKPEKPKYV